MRMGLFSVSVLAVSIFGLVDCSAQAAKRQTCHGDLTVGSLDSAVGECGFITKSDIGNAILTICVRSMPCTVEGQVEGSDITRLFAVHLGMPDGTGFDWRKTRQFRTPSNQIHCMFGGDEKKLEPTGIACEINQTFTRIPIRPRPKDCELDWGYMFELGADSDADLVCASDSVRNEDSPFLTYGNSIMAGKIVCMSEEAGLTCKNDHGHGFFLSRKSQKIF